MSTHLLHREEAHHALFRDRIECVVVHQFVQRTEFLIPQKIMPRGVLEHLKVLHVCPMPAGCRTKQKMNESTQ